MPATNISQIRAVNAAADEGITAQLTAYGVPAVVPGETDDLPDIHCLVLFSRGPAAHFRRTPIGGLEWDIWNGCTVSIELFVPRINSEPATLLGVYDRLGELAARAEHALAPDRLAELNARLSWHHLTRLIPDGEQRGYDDERKIDRHELRYRTTAGVKESSWPTLEAAYALPT